MTAFIEKFVNMEILGDMVSIENLVIKPAEVLFAFIMVWILYLILNRNIVKPLNSIINSRIDKINSSKESLENAEKDFEAKQRQYSDEILTVRKEASEIRKRVLDEVNEFRNSLMEDARVNSIRLVEDKSAELDGEVEKSKKEIKEKSTEIADFVVKSLLN